METLHEENTSSGSKEQQAVSFLGMELEVEPCFGTVFKMWLLVKLMSVSKRPQSTADRPDLLVPSFSVPASSSENLVCVVSEQ